jgi:hypothetical protein
MGLLDDASGGLAANLIDAECGAVTVFSMRPYSMRQCCARQLRSETVSPTPATTDYLPTHPSTMPQTPRRDFSSGHRSAAVRVAGRRQERWEGMACEKSLDFSTETLRRFRLGNAGAC